MPRGNSGKLLSCATIMVGCWFQFTAQASNEEVAESAYLHIKGEADIVFIDDKRAFASSTGTFSALTATIMSNTPQLDGSIVLTSQHSFKGTNGGHWNTSDRVDMTPVQNAPNVFSVKVEYVIVDAFGAMKGYEGQRYSGMGVVNFNTNSGRIEYNGLITK